MKRNIRRTIRADFFDGIDKWPIASSARASFRPRAAGVGRRRGLTRPRVGQRRCDGWDDCDAPAERLSRPVADEITGCSSAWHVVISTNRNMFPVEHGWRAWLAMTPPLRLERERQVLEPSVLKRVLTVIIIVMAQASADNSWAQSSSRFTPVELAGMTFEQWTDTLKGGLRSSPDQPIVIDWIEPKRSIGVSDNLIRGDIRSFYGWCEAHKGFGANAPTAETSLDKALLEYPPLAYSQAAALRDGKMLELSPRETRYKFNICTDAQIDSLGSFHYVLGFDCAWNNKDLSAPFPCRAIIYDRRALERFDATIKPAFTELSRKRTAAKDARATRVKQWRGALAPGDDATIGLVIARNGAVAQIQDASGRTRWVKVAELEPR